MYTTRGNGEEKEDGMRDFIKVTLSLKSTNLAPGWNSRAKVRNLNDHLTGADPGFSLIRGNAKYYVPARTSRAQNQTLFRQGSTGLFWCSLVLSEPYFFKHSHKKKWLKNIVDPILGGRLLRPLDPPLIWIAQFEWSFEWRYFWPCHCTQIYIAMRPKYRHFNDHSK